MYDLKTCVQHRKKREKREKKKRRKNEDAGWTPSSCCGVTCDPLYSVHYGIMYIDVCYQLAIASVQRECASFRLGD